MAEIKREEVDVLKPRTAEQTAQRILAILVGVGKVHDPESCLAWMNKHNLQTYLSPAENKFVKNKKPSEEARAAFSWRAEAVVSLLWALNGIPEMPPFNEQVDVFGFEMIRVAMKDPQAFISQAQLRSAEEISTMENHLYHQHWRVRDAELVDIGDRLEPLPDDSPIEELDPGIVYERRYALSWLIGWGEDWDNVPTDT